MRSLEKQLQFRIIIGLIVLIAIFLINHSETLTTTAPNVVSIDQPGVAYDQPESTSTLPPAGFPPEVPADAGPPLHGLPASSPEHGLAAAHVKYVPDGDSLEVLIAGRTDRIRLSSVDTPEKGQPFADDAWRFTQDSCQGRDVQLELFGRDRFNRLLANVYVEGHLLNHALLAAGWAWSYDREDAASMAIEAQARAAGRGLWIDPQPIRPADWRASHPRP